MQLEWTFETPQAIRAVSLSSDGSRALAAGDGFVVLVDALTGKAVWVYRGGNKMNAATISATGTFEVAGAEEAELVEFNAQSNRTNWIARTDGPVLSTAISRNEQFIAAGVFFGTIYLYRNDSTPELIHGGEGSALSVDLSNSGSLLVAGTYSRKVMLFNSTAGTLAWSYNTSDTVESVSISGDGTRIIAGTNDGQTLIFKTNDPKPFLTYRTLGAIRSVSISANARRAISGGTDSRILLFDTSLGRVVGNLTVSGVIDCTAASDTGAVEVAGSLTGDLYVLQNDTLTPKTVLTGFPVLSIAMSADGSMFLAGGGTKMSYYRLNPSNATETLARPSAAAAPDLIPYYGMVALALVMLIAFSLRRKPSSSRARGNPP